MTAATSSPAYARAVASLEALGIMPTRMPSLEPMRWALDRSGLLPLIDPARNFIIAGTNGKGTTAATFSALLHASGRRVGLYTSPHLVTTRERIRVGEEDLSEAAFAAAHEACLPVIRACALSHFEALTLIAAHVFHSGGGQAPVDYAVWEVGLGGTFDATNAIPHSACAITRLGFDHQNLLGDTLEQIASQKFGVIGPEALVVHAPMDESLAPLREATRFKTGCRWVESHAPAALDLRPEDLALPGPRALENTATAVTLYQELGFGPAPREALRRVRWPGRFSLWPRSGFPCPAYLSGDHNPQGAESLLEILRELRWETLHLVLGIGQDKDAPAMLRLLEGLPRSKLYLTETPFKGRKLSDYPAASLAQAAVADPDVHSLLSGLRPKTGIGDLVVITGSLYLVGQVLKGPNPSVLEPNCS